MFESVEPYILKLAIYADLRCGEFYFRFIYTNPSL